MQVGFIVTKTPAEEGFKSFEKILDLYIKNNEITIYLVGNGVFAAKRGMKHSPLKNIIDKIQVYASGKDLRARGIDDDIISDKIIVFSNFDVIMSDIMENMDQVLSF